MTNVAGALAAPTGTSLRWRRAMSSRIAWAIFGGVVIATLTIGSNHPVPPSASVRIAKLDAVIKCPPCTDLSIEQSDAPQAVALRTSVAGWVHDGWSDARIEAKVVSEYGPTELLRPPAHGIDAVVWVVPLIALVAGATGIGIVIFRRRSLPITEGDLSADEALVRAQRLKDGSR